MPRRLAWPERIPVRWRIAATCAGLTCLILVVFAGVLGNLVGDRVRDDFDDELRGGARALASEYQVGMDPISGPVVSGPNPRDSAMGESVIRVVDEFGRPLASTDRTIDLGPPAAGVTDMGRFSVASEPIPDSRSLPSFVQYAKPDADVEATIGRLWLFLAAGVLGGTILALLAGLRRRRPRHAPDRGADLAGARHRHHPRPLAANAHPGRRRRDRRAGRDHGRHARVAGRGQGRARARPSSASASSSPTPRTSCERR